MIWRLLGFDPATTGFQHHEDKPLGADLVVIDEASMAEGYSCPTALPIVGEGDLRLTK